MKRFIILLTIAILMFTNTVYVNANSNSKNTKYECSYIKNSKIPKKLYVISEKDMSKDERTMISTLQGIISTKSDKQIYILASNGDDYITWLKDLNKNYNVKYEKVKSPWYLIYKFKSYIKGYSLYNETNKSSINNASTLSSLKDSIAINETLENTIKSYGINNLIKDCRDTNSSWAFDNLWNEGLNHSTVVQLSPTKTAALRDYAIMSKSLIFYEENAKDTLLREKIFKSMDSPGKLLGWGPDEHTNVEIASKYGIEVIPADWSYNLSTLSAFQTSPQKQNTHKNITNTNGKHYVTFIMSDGDNQQWYLSNNFTSDKWYGSNKRGNFNLGWSISPSLYYLAPTVFNMYYKNASNNDNFIIPPSGNGYIYPSQFPKTELKNYTQRLSNYMKKVDQKNILMIDDDSFNNTKLWDNFTKYDNVDGIFYTNYKKANDFNGKITWSNSKPIVSCRDVLWDGLTNEDELISTINNRVKLGYTNSKDANSYTFVYVHVWSKSLNDIQKIVNDLNKNSKIEIITPNNFIDLIKNNITH